MFGFITFVLDMYRSSFLAFVFILQSMFVLAQTTSIGGIVNLYYKADSIYTINCKSYITTANPSGLAPGDEVILIQMQGARVDTNAIAFGYVKHFMNAGNFEWGTIKSISGSTIELNNRLLKYYAAYANVQIVKVANYSNARVTSTLRCPAWNGSTGGVLVLSVSDTLHLNASIDVSGTGFRGGNLYPNEPYYCNDTRTVWTLNTGFRGPKGEGIALFNPLYEAGINAIATGGGSGASHNSGAGGGANAGAGGYGGMQTSDCGIAANQGIGAEPVDYFFVDKIFMGGGGGAGQQDEGMATPGMNGGGIAIISCRYLHGNTFTIVANGMDQTADAGNGILSDGAGAGGAGGSIILDVSTYLSAVTVQCNGGRGGNTRLEDPISNTGPGGGGGGGLVWHRSPILPSMVSVQNNGGLAGIVINSMSIDNGTPFGASDGIGGYIKPDFIKSISNFSTPTITSFSSDTTVCAGDSVWIQAGYSGGNTAVNVYWTPNKHIPYTDQNQMLISTKDTLTIYYKIEDSLGCADIDSVTIFTLPLPASNLQDEYIIQLYDSIQIVVPNNDSIYWAPNRFIDSINSFSPWFTPPKSQMYRYYIIDSNLCVLYDSLFIRVKQCTNLGLANIFTPNGDGVNDVYHFKNVLIDELIEFQIYTRWGELVFETRDLSDSWDGTIKGKPASTDVYTYRIKGKCYGALFEDSGNITLVR